MHTRCELSPCAVLTPSRSPLLPHTCTASTNSGNFGAIFPFVDQLFGTYLPAIVSTNVVARGGVTEVAKKIRWLSGAAKTMMLG